jgi:ethanolamine utilization protein EutA
MSESQSLLSVGIDVGTTTTQVVFSRLDLSNVARTGLISRVSITGRQILYQSPILFTPLLDEDTINADQLNAIVQGEYASAGMNPQDVATGAVIITGETAKKKNADAILQSLAGLAGDFIVSIAGPNVESLIAARGSGAAQYSKEHYTTVTNVDIGGGSANAAVFRSGNPLGGAAMNYGGRILILDPASGKIRHIAEPARKIMADCGLDLHLGDIPSMEALRRLCDRMADVTVDLIEGTTSPLASQLYLTPPAPVSGKGSLLMFSGGIGHYYYHPLELHSLFDVTIHEDIGPLLAESLRGHPVLSSYQVAVPDETLRATVLGASTQTVTLSGSTIWAEKEILPLKNVPVIHQKMTLDALPEEIASTLEQSVKRLDLDPASDLYALVLELPGALNYPSLLQLASGLRDFATPFPEEKPLLIIIERDYAQAVGQTVKGLMPRRPLLVIDQVGLMEGDYIDIGTPLMEGRVVPLSVKTLVFYH